MCSLSLIFHPCLDVSSSQTTRLDGNKGENVKDTSKMHSKSEKVHLTCLRLLAICCIISCKEILIPKYHTTLIKQMGKQTQWVERHRGRGTITAVLLFNQTNSKNKKCPDQVVSKSFNTGYLPCVSHPIPASLLTGYLIKILKFLVRNYKFERLKLLI